VCMSVRTGAPPLACICSTARHAAAVQIAYCHLARPGRQRGAAQNTDARARRTHGQAMELSGGASTWKTMPFTQETADAARERRGAAAAGGRTGGGEERQCPVADEQREERDAPAGAPDARGLQESEAE
jgi:hypothetical protein